MSWETTINLEPRFFSEYEKEEVFTEHKGLDDHAFYGLKGVFHYVVLFNP